MSRPASAERVHALCAIGLHHPEHRVKDPLVRRLGFDRLCLDCGRIRDAATDPSVWRYPNTRHLREIDQLPDSPKALQHSNRAFENQKTVNGNTKPAPETKRKQADVRLNPLKNPLCKPDVPSYLTNKPPAVVTSQPFRHDRGVSGRKEPIERQQKTARRKRPSCFLQKLACHTIVQVMKNTQRQDQIEGLQTVRKKRPLRTVPEIKRRRNTEPGGTPAADNPRSCPPQRRPQAEETSEHSRRHSQGQRHELKRETAKETKRLSQRRHAPRSQTETGQKAAQKQEASP